MIGFFAMEEPVSFCRKDSISICRYHTSGNLDLECVEVGEPFVRISSPKADFAASPWGSYTSCIPRPTEVS